MSDPGATARRRARAFPELPEWAGPTTRLVHGARRPDWNAGSVVPPIYQTTTFHFPAEHSEARDRGDVYLYSRLANPSVEGPEETIRRLEGGDSARLFGSGMGAITSTVLSLVRAGDEVVAPAGLYGSTQDLLTDLLPRFGVRVRMLTGEEARSPETAMGPDTRLVLVESPTNPGLHVHDLARWAKAAHGVGALFLVDNTFATPINQHPLALGADVVLHSATKYLAGHSDLLAGAAVGSAEVMARVDAKGYLGASLDPFAAFLLARSLPTLGLRVARHNENGRRVAEALRDHPAIERVHYPGSASLEEEAIAAQQMQGRGGMLSLSLRGGAPSIDPFLGRLRFFHVASSLGSVMSLVSVPIQSSHRHLSEVELSRLGIDPGFVRLSLGIEDPEDLVRDLTEALDAIV